MLKFSPTGCTLEALSSTPPLNFQTHAMKNNLAAIETHPASLRAGVISSFILAICYLCLTGLSSLPRVWALIILSAVCLVLMLKSLTDLLVWVFGLAARRVGGGLGYAVKTLRRLG